jgi:ABC-type phosphonate transport system ATPase subunit
MITAHGLRTRYGDKVAVDDLSFEVRPGVVTGQTPSPSVVPLEVSCEWFS